jgi:hypothetical protein
MRRLRFLALLAMVCTPRAALPQGGPLGPEFRVNTYTTYDQWPPTVASDASGNFVVVWGSFAQDGSAFGIFGQRYASAGTPLGPEFRVNTYTTNDQRFARVASDASGNFVVVWQSYAQDGSGYGIFGQRYASTGTPLGPEFRVNTYTTNDQLIARVASDASGNFVVVWQSYAQDGPGFGIFGQRYASIGVPLGPEFPVNTYTTERQVYPSVASDASGNFVVVWGSFAQDGSGYGVFGQRYASAGTPLAGEFRVNTYTTNSQVYPSVASDASGNFVVVWQSNFQDAPPGAGVFGQRFGSSGAPAGPEFRVNTYTTSYQQSPSVASDASGNFVVVWQSYAQDGSDVGVFGERYASTGVPLGPEFRVNTYTTAMQILPSVAADGSGNFVVVWQSFMQDGSFFGIFGQRYGQIVPLELTGFSVE